MSWDNRVVWSEGLFLQPHHFQQQGRHVETMLSRLGAGLVANPWGVGELALDPDLLKLGKVALTASAGITPDGQPFRIPESDALPAALDVPAGTQNCRVLLVVPTRRAGAAEIDLGTGGASAARYQPEEIEISDVVGGDRRPVTLAVAKLRLRLALETEDLSDHLAIPVARVIEVRSDGSVVLDRAFLPSALDVSAAPALVEFLREVEGLLTTRAEALAGRITASGASRGLSEIEDFLLLAVINRALPEIRLWMSASLAHPQDVHRFLAALAGELATYLAQARRPPDFPPYAHDDPTASFQPVMRELRRYLSAVLESSAVPIPIEERKYGVRVAVIGDRRLLREAEFVLVVRGGGAPEKIRRHFPAQAKLGPVETIRELVNSALPGIQLKPLPVAPRQLIYDAQAVYFSLERDSEHWGRMTTTGGLAIFVSGEFPGLAMELWAIRQ